MFLQCFADDCNGRTGSTYYHQRYTISRDGHDTQKIYNRYNYNYTRFIIIDTTTITLKIIIVDTITNT